MAGLTDVTERAGLKGTGYGMGVAVADYDNDGRPDLYMTNVGHNTLYHNHGNGTFTDVTLLRLVSPLKDGQAVHASLTTTATGILDLLVTR